MADLLMKMPTPYEPKRKNRWVLRFPSELGIQEWFVSTANRPQITQDATEIPFLNTSTYVVGRFVWNTISVTFRDPIGPSASQALMEWVRLHHETLTGRDGYHSFYTKDIGLQILDPVGTVVEQWRGEGAFLTEVDFNGQALDYSTSEPLDVSMTIQCERWILEF